MGNSRSKRLSGNLIASVLNRCIHVGWRILLVPLYLQVWGAKTYGEYLVITAIPTVLATSNLGVGAAAGARLALEIGGEKVKEASRTFFSGMAVTMSISLLFVLAAILFPIIWPNVIPSSMSLQYGHIILALAMVSLASDQSNDVILGIYHGTGRAALGLHIQNGNYFVRLCAMVANLLMHQTPLVLVAVDTAINVVSTAFLFWPTKRCCPQIYDNRTSVDLDLIKELFRTGLGFQASALWQAILFQGSLWLASVTMGAVGAATWGTLRALGRSINQLLTIVNQTAFPELQLAIAQKDYAAARKIHGMAVYISSILGILIALPLVLVGPRVYALWTSGKLEVPYSVWPLIGLMTVLNALWWTSAIVHRAVNRPWLLNLTGVGAAIFSVFLMYILSGSLNITGFVMGALVFEGIMTIRVLSTSLVLLEDNLLTMIRGAYRGAFPLVKLLVGKTKQQPL